MLPAIGYALREENRGILDDPAIDGVELTFERADDPLRIERYVGELNLPYVSVHALKLSPGSSDPPAKHYLEAIKSIAIENGATSISDHLGFTRGSDAGVEMGHFAPLPLTQQALDTASGNIDLICKYFAPRHFYIENIAYLFQLEGALCEADFLARLLARTGCGWLLDVTNVYANATNFGFDPYEFVDQVMPAARRVQMHLAGGFFDEKAGMYIDSHSHPLPDPVWDLYAHALRAAGKKVEAVFVERDQNYPDDTEWRREIRRVRSIAETVAAPQHSSMRDTGISTPTRSTRLWPRLVSHPKPTDTDSKL